jgi:hypothetical protein
VTGEILEQMFDHLYRFPDDSLILNLVTSLSTPPEVTGAIASLLSTLENDGGLTCAGAIRVAEILQDQSRLLEYLELDPEIARGTTAVHLLLHARHWSGSSGRHLEDATARSLERLFGDLGIPTASSHIGYHLWLEALSDDIDRSSADVINFYIDNPPIDRPLAASMQQGLDAAVVCLSDPILTHGVGPEVLLRILHDLDRAGAQTYPHYAALCVTAVALSTATRDPTPTFREPRGVYAPLGDFESTIKSPPHWAGELVSTGDLHGPGFDALRLANHLFRRWDLD